MALSRIDVIYSVFGLAVSSNLTIPGLSSYSAAPAISPDLRVYLGQTPHAVAIAPAEPEDLIYASSYTNDAGNPALHIWRGADGLRHLKYDDGIEFWIDRSAKRVWGTWPESSSLEDLATYLLGPVLGFVLRIRGIACLHASAVVLNGKAVAFAGDAGAGKSTTAGAFARLGETVVSDDVVALSEHDGRFYVAPAYPYLSLWDDSVAMLYGEGKSLPSFSRNFPKRMLSLGNEGLRFADDAVPLGTIFLLGEPRGRDHGPVVEKLSTRESLLGLVANSYATNLLDPEMRAREFAMFGRMIDLVPVRRARWPGNSRDPDRFCEAIRQAYDELSGAGPANRAVQHAKRFPLEKPS